MFLVPFASTRSSQALFALEIHLISPLSILQPIVKNLAAIARQYLKVQVKKANLEGNNTDSHLSILD